MFRNRTSSRKPNAELYAAFKQSFPELVTDAEVPSTTAPSHHGSTSIANAPSQSAMDHRQFCDVESARLQDLTPRGQADQWRLTPSMLDPNSVSFASFTNQFPGYQIPTPGGINTVYHNPAAGDLHTPGMALQLGTPLSMPMSDGPLAAPGPHLDATGFHPHLFQDPGFNQANGFPVHQQTFPPSMLVHQDSGYGPFEESPSGGSAARMGMQQQAKVESGHQFRPEASMPDALRFNDKFRYHVTLNAPTAMIRHHDEIPISYLNKGQAYTITIIDSMPLAPSPGPVKYRTVVRISFEDEQQRKRPSACWQLWKEGRGLAESHQRGGKLQAVEFVDPHPGAEDDPRRPRIELEKTSFDCFAVNWSPSAAAVTAECAVAVRFNFLSTDFSHSKGVKGIPVRFCTKTEQISSGTPDTPPPPHPEVSYCKVKLFRDHGAERKLSNDVAHVKKTIDKLKQQIAQVESGMKDVSKRKRTASMAGKAGGERPNKMAKHKRAWSVSSQGSTGRPAPEEDLHQKLAAMQDMFTSTRPVSVLYLKGTEEDDPDVFPVSLPLDPLSLDTSKAGLRRQSSWDTKPSGEASNSESSLESPLVSARTLGDRPSLRKSSTFRTARNFAGDWPLSAVEPGTDYTAGLDMGLTQDEPARVKRRKRDHDDGMPDWLEALGVDPSYVPPPEPEERPVACFYVRTRDHGCDLTDTYFRAVYLHQRSVSDLVSSICRKCDVDASRVSRSFRINDKGLRILLDDELVHAIPEGQDLNVEFVNLDSAGVKLEPAGVTDGLTLASIADAKPVELRLFF